MTKSQNQTSVTILDLMDDPRFFARWFKGPTWNAWRVFLSAVFALTDRIDADGMAIYRAATGREIFPSAPVRRIDTCVGRRGGKSLIAALIAVYLAFFRDYSKYLVPGETATVLCDAADRPQAHVVFRYIKAFIFGTPVLKAMVIRETREVIELSNSVTIEVHAASSKTGGRSDLTGPFCTSGSEREFTLEGSWYADQEIQTGADRNAAAAG